VEGYEVNGYTIYKAVDKGFYVIPNTESRHESMIVACAGTLDECLVYVKEKMEIVVI